MHRCYQLGELALQQGESPVGSVIVKDGIIIGEAFEKSRQLKDVTRHAEVLAIAEALKNVESLAGTTLYTNMEPCLLCSYVIRHHNISEVVFAQHSGELGGTHKPFNLLSSSDFKCWGDPPIITFHEGEQSL